jgi:CRISPR-associated protein Cmr6
MAGDKMGSLQDELIKKGLSQKPVPNVGMKDRKRDMDNKKNDKKDKGSSNKDASIPLCLPLYKDLKDFILMRDQDTEQFESFPHPGLVFDKFPCHWSGPDKWKDKTNTRKKQDVPDAKKDPECWNPNPKTWFLKKVIQLYMNNNHIKDLLSSYHARQDSLLLKLNGKSHTFSTHWRFVSGLGMGHVLETGFVWHRTLGVPYLPGSSVKGLIRAWADPEKGWNNGDDWGKGKEYKRLFGDEKDMGAGSLIVFDAIPDKTPKLEVDIMNPHYGDYYSKKIDDKGNPTPPADYLSPNPIFFLTVAPDAVFRFALAPRDGQDTDAFIEGFELLKCALETIGAGAKTAVGYGYFK